jgi:hypothetical protein
VSDASRRLRYDLLARQAEAKRRGGRTLGRRPEWSPLHEKAFIDQAKRVFRGSRELPLEGRP